MKPIMTLCEVCQKRVFMLWFTIAGDRRAKCGECCSPRRAEAQRVFPDHDAGDEDRTEAVA